MMRKMFWLVLLISLISLSACSSPIDQPSDGAKLKIVATTTIVGDVVSQVGGDLIELTILLPVGIDPHSFDPTPKDVATVANADVVFANGAGLEEFLDNLIESAGAEDKVVHVSNGIDFLIFEGDNQHGEAEQHVHTDTPAGADPHTWTDPNNVIVWVHNIEQKLSELDPDSADSFEASSKEYEAELKELDAWIHEKVAQIPETNRKLVTDHIFFSYFAEEYGIEQIGALFPGYSTLAEPTAQELAEIEDAIKSLDVKAIFVGNTLNQSLAEQVAEDTGTQLIFVYTGSLSEPGGKADTYINYMHYNTNAFVNALTLIP